MPAFGGSGRTEIDRRDQSSQIAQFKSHVFACTSLLAQVAATAELRLFYGPRSEREEIKEHRFLDMWQNVNPYTNHFEFMELGVSYLCLAGDHYVQLIPDGLGVPTEMHIIPPAGMQPIPGKDRLIDGYRQRSGGSSKTFAAEEIIQFKLPNPYDPYYHGLSYVCAAALEIADQNHIDGIQDSLFKNLNIPGVGIVPDGELSPEQYRHLKEEIEENRSGIDRAGIPWILDGIKEVITWENTVNLRDFSFLKGRANIKETIYNIWKVPLTFGSRDSTPARAALENDMLRLGLFGVKPMLVRMQEKLNEQLLPRFDKGLWCEFDLSTIIPPNEEGRLREVESHINCGYSTVDEERAKDRLPPRPDGGGTQGKIINPMGFLDEELPPEEPPAPEGKRLAKKTRLVSVPPRKIDDLTRSERARMRRKVRQVYADMISDAQDLVKKYGA